MKLTFRTVSGESFQMDAEETTSVGDIKSSLESSRSIARDTMKLVYRGKVLDDDSATLGAAGINEQGFIVVFVAKKTEAAKAAVPPVAAAPAPTSETPVSAPAPAPASTPAPTPAATPAPDAPAPASEAAAAVPAAVAPVEAVPAAIGEPGAALGSFLVGSALEGAVSNICEMGFDRSEVMRAMRAAFNNPERAVEYLMTGIPESAAAPPPPAPGAAAHPAPVAGAAAAPPSAAAVAASGPAAMPFNMFGGPAAAGAGAGGAPGAGGGSALDFLRTNPQFQLLRHAVRGNPGILTPMLQEIGRSNPQLIHMIQGHQDEFLRILQEDPGEADMDLAGLAGMEGEGDGEGAVELTEEDMQKVERLEALGFQREDCIQALLACDRNEEMAANFLAEQMFD